MVSGGITICQNQFQCGRIYIESLKAWNNTAELYFPVFLTNQELHLNDIELFNNTGKGSNYSLDIFSTHEMNIGLKIFEKDIKIIPGKVYDLKFYLVSRIDQNLLNLSFGNSFTLTNDMNNGSINSLFKSGMIIFSSFQTSRNNFKKKTIEFKCSAILNLHKYFFFSLYRVFNLSNTRINQNFTINFTDCENGDIWKEDKGICSKCQKPFFLTKFSYEKNKKCLDCPSELEHCGGGSDIVLKKGYWRKNQFSSLILKCYNEDACNQRKNYSWDFSDRFCSDNHRGNLCFNCDDDYGKASPRSLCTKCEDQYLYFFLKGPFYILIISLYFFIMTIHSTIKEEKSEERNDYLNPLLNIFLSFNQLYLLIDVQIINFYSVDWDLTLRTYFIEYITIINSRIYISDCIMKEIAGDRKIRFYLGSSISLYIFIILILVTISIFWFIFKLIAKAKIIRTIKKFDSLTSIKNFLVISCLIIFNLFYTSLISLTLNLLDCIKISNDEQELYLSSNPLIKCWDDEHIRILTLLGLPNIIIFGFIIPTTLLYLLRRLSKIKVDNITKSQFKRALIVIKPYLNKKRKTRITVMTENIKMKFKSLENFLLEKNILLFYYEGYKVKFYYWELLRIFLKLICSIVMNCKSYIDQKNIGILLFVTFLIYFLALIHFQPYDNLNCNRLDILSTMGLIVVSMNKYTDIKGKLPEILQYSGIVLIILIFLYSIIHVMKLIIAQIGFKLRNENIKLNIKSDIKYKINFKLKRRFY